MATDRPRADVTGSRSKRLTGAATSSAAAADGVVGGIMLIGPSRILFAESTAPEIARIAAPDQSGTTTYRMADSLDAAYRHQTNLSQNHTDAARPYELPLRIRITPSGKVRRVQPFIGERPTRSHRRVVRLPICAAWAQRLRSLFASAGEADFGTIFLARRGQYCSDQRTFARPPNF